MSITVREAVEGFKTDNALLAGSAPAVVERNNLAIKALEMLEKKESKRELASLKPEETFKLAGRDFIVLEHDYLEDGYTAVITKDLWKKGVKFGDSRDYNTSKVKKIMEDVAAEIEKEVGAENLFEHEVSLTSVDMQNEFGSCRCKVRPISFDEARKFNNMLVNKELPDWYWTLTPWSTADRGYTYSIAVVSPSGDVYNFSCYNGHGVRPFCILKSNIFVSKGE